MSPRPQECGAFDCVITFVHTAGGTPRVFCSDSCAKRQKYLKKRKTPVEQTCKVCGTIYTPKPRQKYCDTPCRSRAQYLRIRKKAKRYAKEYHKKNRSAILDYHKRLRSNISPEVSRAIRQRETLRTEEIQAEKLDRLWAHLWKDNDGRDDAERSGRAVAEAGS